jgi:hypothetical protein
VNKRKFAGHLVLQGLSPYFLVGFFSAIHLANKPSPRTSPANACSINKLRQIDAAANQFALENHLTNGDRINFPNDLTPYIKLNREGKIPRCPSGGILTMWSARRTRLRKSAEQNQAGYYLSCGA